MVKLHQNTTGLLNNDGRYGTKQDKLQVNTKLKFYKKNNLNVVNKNKMHTLFCLYQKIEEKICYTLFSSYFLPHGWSHIKLLNDEEIVCSKSTETNVCLTGIKISI